MVSAFGFDDGKEEGALRTIGEVSRALDIKPHVLRYWEQQFPMLKPLKRSGGRRYYRSEDVALVQRIDRLVNFEGYTIKGAVQAIKSGRSDEGDTLVAERDVPTASDDLSDAERAELVGELKAIRKRLEAALEG